MNLDNPIHRLKQIIPKIHQKRNRAVSLLFEEIYAIVKWKLGKDKGGRFLFIPISGMHLGGHTSEHFFLEGAPIGIFNILDKEERINAVSSILTYSLFNIKVNLSATKTINSLIVNGMDCNIISFASIKINKNETPKITKNYLPYTDSVLGVERFLDTKIWNKIFEKVKVAVSEKFESENIFEISNVNETLEKLKEEIPFQTIGANNLLYVVENIVEHANTSKLNFNYYFPSLHFELESQRNHSYGFMVVSTDTDLNEKESSSDLINFFENLSLVTFSLVGIIEQHYYGKIEKWKAFLDLVDKIPENILGLSNNPEFMKDKEIVLKLNEKIPHNALRKAAGIIFRTLKNKNLGIKEEILYGAKWGIFEDLFLWNNEAERSIDELKTTLLKHSFLYRYNEFVSKLIEQHPKEYSSRWGHSYANYQGVDNEDEYWITYSGLINEFSDLMDEKMHFYFHKCSFKNLAEFISNKKVGTDRGRTEGEIGLSDCLRNLEIGEEEGCEKILVNRKAVTNWRIWKMDLLMISKTICDNRVDKTAIPFSELKKFVNDDWVILYHKSDNEVLTEEHKKIIEFHLNKPEIREFKLNALKTIVCNYYQGELIWFSYDGLKGDNFKVMGMDDQTLQTTPEIVLQKNNELEKGTYYFVYLPKNI